GLLRQEVVNLLWGDVHLDATTPYLQLRSKAAKSRRADSLPIRTDIDEELRAMRGEAADCEKVFEAVPSMDDRPVQHPKPGARGANRVATATLDRRKMTLTGRTRQTGKTVVNASGDTNWQQKTLTGVGEGEVRHLGLEPRTR